MTDADNPEHGQDLRFSSVPPAVETSADHAGSRHFTRTFFCACSVALVWTIVLLGYIAAKTTVVSTVAATLVSVVTIITLIIGVFQPPKFPTIDPKVTQAVVAIILVVDFVVSGGWVGWSYYQANRTINVLSVVTLSQDPHGVLPGGQATLDLPITAQRDVLALVFQVADYNSGIGSCTPNTSLLVTPSTAGNRGDTVSADSGVPTMVDLPAGAMRLHLDIMVTNTRGDHNCSVILSIKSAKLQNK